MTRGAMESDLERELVSLARVFAEREEWSLALGKAQEAMDAVGDEAAPLEVRDHFIPSGP